MFSDDEKFSVHILSVLELEWGVSTRESADRPFHAISFRISGDTFFRHKDKEYHVGSGDIAYVPAGFKYIHEHKKEHLYVVHFEIAGGCNNEFFSFSPKNAGIYNNLFKSMYDIWISKRIGYRHAATAIFYKILEHMTCDVSKERLKVRNDNMNEVIEYIHNNYSDREISIAYLAGIFGTSETYFRREFKKKLGTTPLKYINGMKLRHAIELLESGYYSVKEAADVVGFDDPKYFSRLVKKDKGKPPSQLM